MDHFNFYSCEWSNFPTLRWDISDAATHLCIMIETRLAAVHESILLVLFAWTADFCAKVKQCKSFLKKAALDFTTVAEPTCGLASAEPTLAPRSA